MDAQDDKTAAAAPVRSLKEAIRKARMAQAERTDAMIDLRAAEITRLELLLEEVEALLTPMEGDAARFDLAQFDLALTQGQTPRLWIDMLAFVAMGRDRKTYRFVRDTRSGRQLLAESGDAKDVARAVLDYVAHQIIEREKALADLPATELEPRPGFPAVADAPHASEAPLAPARRRSGWAVACAFLLGAAAGAAGLLAYAYFAMT